MYLHPGIKLGMNEKQKSYPSDVSDEEWSFCVSYLTLMKEEAPQREYRLREIFNALRYLVRMGGVWRMMPHDLPPWHVVLPANPRVAKVSFPSLRPGFGVFLMAIEGVRQRGWNTRYADIIGLFKNERASREYTKKLWKQWSPQITTHVPSLPTYNWDTKSTCLGPTRVFSVATPPSAN